MVFSAMMKTAVLRCLFFCSILGVWQIPLFASSQYDFSKRTVIETTETGELVNIDESLIRLIAEAFDTTGSAGGCSDCEFNSNFGNLADTRRVYKRLGRCFGIIEPFIDGRLLDLSVRKMCNGEGICCDVVGRYINVYFTYFSNANQRWEQAIKDCVATCADPEDCLVLHGHSLAGPVIELAGFVFSQYKPTVIMSGSAPVFTDGCPGLNKTKFFHIENSMRYPPDDLLTVDSTSFFPGHGPIPLGHQILLSRETNAVSYWGYNQPLPRPAGLTGLLPFRRGGTIVGSSPSHNLFNFVYSYRDHLQRIINQGVFPVPFGWDDGVACSRDIDCKSGNCAGGFCAP